MKCLPEDLPISNRPDLRGLIKADYTYLVYPPKFYAPVEIWDRFYWDIDLERDLPK